MSEENKTFLCGLFAIAAAMLLVMAGLMCLCCYLNQRYPEKRIYEIQPEQMELIVRTIQETKQ